ncbi:MAG: hypothetical protein M3081_13695 [Gemmatimonadota bacterium]|nr:hypothetical protein [Gemmatimonadota bacterium]
MAHDDHTRHRSPAPPHDPHTPEHAPGSEQSWQKGQTLDPIWGTATTDDATSGNVARGGGGSRIGIAAMSAVAFLAAMPTGAQVVACLYPLGAGLAIAVGGAAYLLSSMAVPNAEYGTRVALAVIPALFVWWPASRAEQRFGERRAYRAARHIARLVLFAAYAYWLSRRVLGGEWPPSIGVLRRVFVSPAQLGIVAGTVVGVHVVLTRVHALRGIWHVMLWAVWLRPD